MYPHKVLRGQRILHGAELGVHDEGFFSGVDFYVIPVRLQVQYFLEVKIDQQRIYLDENGIGRQFSKVTSGCILVQTTGKTGSLGE